MAILLSAKLQVAIAHKIGNIKSAEACTTKLLTTSSALSSALFLPYSLTPVFSLGIEL